VAKESSNRQQETKKKELAMFNAQAITNIAPGIKYHPSPKRYYFDVTLGSILLSGEDTGGAYCLLELYVAPGKGIGRHTHTREDEAYFVLSGELEATIGDDVFVLKAGETLIAPRDIPHALCNPGKVANHYLTMFSPPGFEGFLKAISVAAPDGAAAPTDPPQSPIENVVELAVDYGIQFG
jgi:mannose-6-phosphate isomerase-like protein (cupin superfamily)